MLPGLALARSEYENDANDRGPCFTCEGDCRGPDCLFWDGDEPDTRGCGPGLRSRGWS